MMVMDEPLVSVIIPCYNQGVYVEEAIQSALDQHYINMEIIVVNDGSNDVVTEKLLTEMNPHQQVKIIHTKNEGLSAARNTAIANSKGKYILPLDADDKIAENYISLAVAELEKNNEIGIVYGRAFYFGERKDEWKIEKFDMAKMILFNQIYASAMFRRKDFDTAGGYDSGMLYGWEDWDFWLGILELNRKVFFIDEVVFFYRIVNGSMVRKMTDEQKEYLRLRIYTRHANLFKGIIKDPVSLYYDKEYYKTSYEKLMSNKIIRLVNGVSKKWSRK